jgi:Trk K+ transport system NAD-binding subunit
MVTSVYHVVGVPGTDYVINSTDRLLLFGKNKDIDRFIEINE